MKNTFKSEIQNKKILILFIATLFLFLAGTVAQYKKSARSTNNDFLVYYKTSKRISDLNWIDIYTRKDGPFPYRYIPYSLVSITWLDQFEESDARKIWLLLQVLGFAGGFYYLYKSLVSMGSRWALVATCASVVLTFRHFLDSLYSGQVAGLIFLSFSLGFYFFLNKKTVLNGVSNSFATSLKIFPGILLILGFIKADGKYNKLRFLLYGIALFLTLNLILASWLYYHHSIGHFVELWQNWMSIVLADSEYFDGSTPKSQAFRAFLLRTFGKTPFIESLWKILTVTGLIALIIYWIKKSIKNNFDEAFNYCLGILAFIFFMPESLPYQVVNVAIPLAVLIGHPKMKTSLAYKIMLAFFMILISFASTDFIGRWPADKVQALSLPFFVMCFMAYLLLKTDQVVKT